MKRYDSPQKIQSFVSRLKYNPNNHGKSAELVYREKTGHCFEGALIASLLLENLGHPPHLLHLRAHRDDDHVVSLFKLKGKWGAIGKSNTTLLSWREPVYKNVEALAMSYFPFYFNTKGQMSLIGWAGPVKLDNFKKWNWRSGQEDVLDMSADFYRVKNQKIMTIAEIEKLPKASPQLVQACFMGADQAGLYSD